ncbi:MAG: prephenate dehydrogenase/arogenate dehydrogenase family protein [Clostridia bacterium]|nr:prephenate dehydrogenase/arogenate dehydrogenase family protein [Clostridia bacterium]MBP3588724.1 prephenate dehydrogenase/arogenate dehydrogenase family protein [Clostridia bacterium]
MTLDKDTRFLIVGLGLLGGSYAKALKKQGFSVEAVTRSQSTIDYALEQGIIDGGAAFPDPEIIGRADFVVLAMYPQTLLDWVKEHQRHFKPGALITDVTGVKTCVVKPVQQMLRPDVEFIAAHPMAGRETLGVRNADDSIFRGANYIVTPTEKNTPQAIEACEELGRVLGFARVSRLTPEKHDEMIGFVSQLTHAIAVALMTCNDIEGLEKYTGDSFRDLTRIAKINDEMWSELFLANREALLEQMDQFTAQFAVMRQQLAAGDREGMRDVMRRSTVRRKALEKQDERK